MATNTHIVDTERCRERLFEALITGSRPAARDLVEQARAEGLPAEHVLTDLFWPLYETIETLHRQDQLSQLSYRLASRLLRVLVDQGSQALDRPAPIGRTVFAVSGPSEGDEMGAQLAVDLLEARGYDVTYAGGGIPNDEIMGQIHESRPDIFLTFATAPTDLPEIRALIDNLHEIGACPDLQIAVGGGVFNRAEGLAEEIGADIWAADPLEMVESLTDLPTQRATADQRTVGKKRLNTTGTPAQQRKAA